MCVGYDPVSVALPFFIDGILMLVVGISLSVISLVRKWNNEVVKITNISLLFISLISLFVAYLKMVSVTKC
jgi:hypothetical protein